MMQVVSNYLKAGGMTRIFYDTCNYDILLPPPLLNAHTSNNGIPWSLHPASVPGATMTLTQQASIRRSGGSGGDSALYYMNIVVPVSDYVVETDLQVLTPDTATAIGILGRMNITSLFGAYGFRVSTGQVWQLLKYTNGVPTVISLLATTITTNTTYRLRLEMIGSNIAGYVNGIKVVEAVDTAYTTGYAGVTCSGAVSGSSTGRRLGNLEIWTPLT